MLVALPLLLCSSLGSVPSGPSLFPHHSGAADPVTGVQEAGIDSVEAARAALASSERAKRLEAVTSLTKIGGDYALDLMLEALADPDPYVADRAQTVLPELDGKATLMALLGKRGIHSKSPLVQRRAAEVLGRLEGPIDAQDLFRKVKKNDVRLARTMLWSLERLAERNALDGNPTRTRKSVRLMTGRGDHDALRAAAMQTLSILDSYDSTVAMDNLKVDSEPETACALLDVLARLRPEGYEASFRIGLEHEQAGVRMRALDILMQGGIKRPDLDALIQRLGAEPRTAVRRRVLYALQYFTGHGAGAEREAWEAFARTLGNDWTSAETTNSLTQKSNVHGGLAQLEELDPVSDRLAVLVDISASYWGDAASGVYMAESVSPAIGRVLERLDQTGSFLLVPFAEAPIPFSEVPLEATPANVA